MLGIAIGILAVATAVVGITASHRSRCRERARREVAARYLASAADEREAALRLIVAEEPANPVAWYLLGATCLRSGRVREATRAFGAAYHRDCGLETAALLTFACLKARDGDGADLEELALRTWEEMGRPDLNAHATDRRVVDCLATTTRDTPRLSPVARLIWVVGTAAMQRRIEAGLASPDGGAALSGGAT